MAHRGLMKETVASYIQMTYLLSPPLLMTSHLTFSHPQQMVPERSLRWRFYDRRVKLSIILCLCILISEKKTTNQLYRAYPQKNPLYKSLYHKILSPQLPRVSPFFTPIPYVSSNRRETRKKTNLQLCTGKKQISSAFFLSFLFSSTLTPHTDLHHSQSTPRVDPVPLAYRHNTSYRTSFPSESRSPRGWAPWRIWSRCGWRWTNLCLRYNRL